MADVPTAQLLGPDGSPKGEVELDPAFFGVEPSVGAMHQVVNAQLAAARAGTHNTKTRAEVRGGGRKPWRQKGLGRARHGSIRSPQWVGGGKAHGPKPRSYVQRTPRKMKRLALRSALSARAGGGQVKVVERFDWSTPRTKDALSFLANAGVEGKVLVVVGPSDNAVVRSFRNLPEAAINEASQLNTYDLLWADTILFTQETLSHLVGSPYDVSDEDFVREDVEAADAPDEEPIAASQQPVAEAGADEEEVVEEEPVASSPDLEAESDEEESS